MFVAYPVQQVVQHPILQLVAHCTSDAGRTHGALSTQHPESLRHDVLRATEPGCKVTDEDSWGAVQT